MKNSAISLAVALFLTYSTSNTMDSPQSDRMAHWIESLHRAAARSNVHAQCILGLLYAQGKDVPQNFTIAAQCFKHAAQKGYATAQSMLGICYEMGKGVEQSDQLAEYWLREAAAQGDIEAERRLAKATGSLFR